MATVGPVLQVLIAFNNNATDDPALITTVASPAGSLGGANVWTDVTRFVVDDTGFRGSQHELKQFQAGERTLTLRNDDGRFTPWNTAGPYTPLVVPRRPLQVNAVWSAVTYPRYTGQIDTWTVNWPDSAQQTVTVHCSDPFRIFNTAMMTGNIYAALVLMDKPSGLWLCNDIAPPPPGVTAPNLVDSSGNGNGLPIDSRTAFTTFGVTGPGVGNTQAISTITQPPSASVPAADNIASGTAFTMEMWAKIPSASLPLAASTPLLTVGPLAGGVSVFVQVGSSGYPVTALGALTNSVNICDNNWHHVVWTFSPAGAGPQGLYVDGVGVSNNIGATSWSGQSIFFPNDGAHFFATPIVFSAFAVYPAALTAAQVTAHYRAAIQTYPQEQSDTRINACLDVVPWPTTARNIDTGNSTVQSITPGTTTVLAAMQQTESTEQGALFMTAGGAVRFVARHNLWSTTAYRTAQATFGDNTAGGDIPYLAGASVTFDDIDIFNDAQATRTGGAAQEAYNQPSINLYGRQTWNPPTSLLNTTDTEVLNMLNVVVSKYATPAIRLPSITVDVAALASSLPAVIPALLSLDLLQRVTVERTVMPGGGTAFTEQANIEHVSETIVAATGEWTITFGLAKPDLVWVLGVSQLGIDTALGY